MTEAEVKSLMTNLESDRIERTTSFRESKLAEAVCAFANDLPNHRQPGYILLGVDDDGRVANISIGDEQLQQVGNVRSNGNVLPQPYLTVSPVFRIDGGDVVVVTVYPADFPPVRYRGRVHVRLAKARIRVAVFLYSITRRSSVRLRSSSLEVSPQK